MDITTAVAALGDTRAKTALKRLLTTMVTPAFGALPKREIDLLVFDTLIDVGAISPTASTYELMTSLRITRAKANQLVFERAVRSRTATDLDAGVIAALAGARFEKAGEAFSIEIEDPLLHAHLKERLRRLGHASDTSFNAALVRMSLDAARDLVVDVMPADRLETVRKALVKAGAPEEGVKGVLGRALRAAGGKAATEAGGMATDAAKDQIKALMTGAAPTIAASFASMFT